MRKKAGDVREMDVLTGLSAMLLSKGDDQRLIKLLEHLGAARARGASKWRKTVAKRRKVAGRRLKACALLVEKNFDKRSASKLWLK
jgi:hypothetical protein